jgi:toxin ParE1/3/4
VAEYRLAPAAERDLANIWHYTRQEWGSEQADRYVDLLMSAFTSLADAPMSAPACEHIRPGYRRRHVARHMIYVRITEYGIAIVRILHERADAPRHL